MKIETNLYRYEDGPLYDGIVSYRNVKLKIFNSQTQTEHSYILDQKLDMKYNLPKQTSVLKEGLNLYAFDSKEKALNNYLDRKKKQIKILQSRIQHAKMLLAEAEQIDLNTL